jgi:hypothetical protein
MQNEKKITNNKELTKMRSLLSNIVVYSIVFVGLNIVVNTQMKGSKN